MVPGGAIATALALLAAPSPALAAEEVRVLAEQSWGDGTRLRQSLVLDRLIRQGGNAPVDLLVQLFPRFRHETTILLVRHPERPAAAWASLLPRTNVADENWVAFANALLRERAPALAHHLLAKLPRRLQVRAVSPDQVSGGGHGMVTGCPLRGQGPRRPCYEMADRPLREAGWVQLSADAFPVYYRRDEKDGDAHNCGHCFTRPSGESATRYLLPYLAALAQLPAGELQALIDHDEVASPAEPRAGIAARARLRHTLAWRRVARALLEHRVLDRAPAAAPIELDLTDQRVGVP